MSMDDIEQVFVLVPGNCSFGGMLGELYKSDPPSHIITGDVICASPGTSDPFRGLPGVDGWPFANVALNASGATRTQCTSIQRRDAGLCEQFDSVAAQRSGDPGEKMPKMSDVVAEFSEVLQEHKFAENQFKASAPRVMACVKPCQLPAQPRAGPRQSRPRLSMAS